MEHTQVALVTGGMDGLGTAICRCLYDAGLRVATTYGMAEPAPQGWLAAQRDEGYRFSAYKVEVGDYADSEWMVQKLLADMGRLDVLVNYTAIERPLSLARMERADWRAVLDGRLGAMYNLSRQAIEPMLAQRWGRIINVATSPGLCAQAEQVNHGAANAAMHGFSKALARELAAKGVTVNTVSPGALRLDLGAPQAAPAAHVPVGRLGEADEVGALVAYLASEQAGFITGANIAINGGQHMC